MKKQPITLIERIPMGYSVGINFIKKSLIKYLDIAPKEPPKPINKRFIDLYCCESNYIFVTHIIFITNIKTFIRY